VSRQRTCVFLLSTMLIAAPSAQAQSIIGQLARSSLFGPFFTERVLRNSKGQWSLGLSAQASEFSSPQGGPAGRHLPDECRSFDRNERSLRGSSRRGLCSWCGGAPIHPGLDPFEASRATRTAEGGIDSEVRPDAVDSR
jgi:hypothetical protein